MGGLLDRRRAARGLAPPPVRPRRLIAARVALARPAELHLRPNACGRGRARGAARPERARPARPRATHLAPGAARQFTPLGTGSPRPASSRADWHAVEATRRRRRRGGAEAAPRAPRAVRHALPRGQWARLNTFLKTRPVANRGQQCAQGGPESSPPCQVCGWNRCAFEVVVGLGRIVALYHRSPTLYQCIFSISISEATMRPNPRWSMPSSRRTPPRWSAHEEATPSFLFFLKSCLVGEYISGWPMLLKGAE